MKNIWIFNHHALTPSMSGGTRHFDFAKELVKRGYKVSIFASSFHYSQYKELKEYSDKPYLFEEVEGINFIWIKTRPYEGNGTGRVWNMLEYMYKVQKTASKIKMRPDLIIGSSVHLFAVYAAYKVAKKMSVPFVMEVRDIWPKTLVDMGISRWHPFILLLAYLEKFLYKKADKVITNLPYAHKHIEKFGVNRIDIVWISNGVDIGRNEKVLAHNYQDNKLHVTYAGAIGQANQLNTLIQAAIVLKDNTNIMFHIIGDGPVLSGLKEIASDNVVFYGALSKHKAIAMLKGSDVLFFPLIDSPIFNYGISSNKLFDYLASKKPVLFASNAKNNPIKEANAGLSVKAENVDDVVKAVIAFKEMGVEQRHKLGENGYAYVCKYFAIPVLVDKLEVCFSSLVYNASKKER